MEISDQRRKDLDEVIKLYIKINSENNENRKYDFVEYSGLYHITNEPISEFIQKANICDEAKVLSVLSGGDQVFNFVNAGIKNIDTFDINRLTEYYALGFKKRAIECLNYQHFLKLFSYYQSLYSAKHYNLYPELENYVIENADEEYKWFWQEFKYGLKQEGYDASIFHLAVFYGQKNNKNNYLKSAKDYRNLKSNLKQVNITFKQASVKNIPENFEVYDLIFLSNIMDYSSDIYGDFAHPLLEARNLLDKICEHNLTSSGEILMTYLTGSFIPFICETNYYKAKLSEIVLDNGKEHAYKLIKK